jgi:Pectate lyase superfamily protein
VAIVQISRITQRKGLEADLPQPLAGAELGWAIDQRKLFIGNGTLEDGAPVVGNTEVLTEFSDILSFATQYIYKGDAAGYTVQTGSTPGDPVSQSIQSRLDSIAIITDFGPVGDPAQGDVAADINRALKQIFCPPGGVQLSAARRSIYFPAGTYIITDTLAIPPNCYLYGDGPDSTIISFDVQSHTSAVAYSAGILVASGSSYYRSLIPVPIGILISNTTYWTIESLPDYIVQTADSLQQTGVNIGTNGASQPSNVEISNMKFVTNRLHNGLLIENANRFVFNNVTVQGPLAQTTLTDADDDIAAVRWASSEDPDGIITQNVTWNNCKFSGFTYGTKTEQQIQDVTFSNCNFDTLYQGIVLGGDSLINNGATGVRMVQNIFDNIHSEGIVIDGVSRNATAYNTFYDVGNEFNGYAFPATSIILIDAENNVSIGDMFGRSTAQSATYPRINLANTTSISLGMNITDIEYYQDNVQNNNVANQLSLGRYQRTAGIRDNLVDDSTRATLVVVDTDILKIPAFKLDYTIIRNDYYRTGTMTVVSGQNDTPGTGFCYSDDYVENGDTGVTLDADHNASIESPNVTISYTATGAGDGTIKYSISHIS